MKACPFCAEQIQDAAIKCRFCGSMLDGSEPAPAHALAKGPQVAPNAPPGVNAAALATLPASALDRPIYNGTPSWKAWYGTYLGAAALAGVGVSLAVVLSVVFAVAAIVALPVGAALFVTALVIVAVAEVRRRATQYRVSSRSIDVEEGIFARRINTLQLWRVRDVVFEQSLTQRMLGVASIRLIVHDETTPKVLLAGLSNGRHVFEEMKSAVDRARQSRSVVGVVD